MPVEERRTEEYRGSEHHGLFVVDATVRESVMCSFPPRLFVFS